MREFIERQRQARAYDGFLASKVEAGRVSMRAGTGRANADAEAKCAAQRTSVGDSA